MTTNNNKPLSDVTILEFGHYIAAPFCGQILADLGATVIKVEPMNGEASRHAAPFYDDTSLYYPSMNRNKLSLSIDLKSPESGQIVSKLVSGADAVITNYAVDVPERLGIGRDALLKFNPTLTYVHLSGYGLDGPRSHDPAFDGIIQSMAGLVDLTGPKGGPPSKPGLYIADHISALYGVIAVLAGLRSPGSAAGGSYYDISMFESVLSLLAYTPSYVSLLDERPTRRGNSSANVFASVFEARDGFVYIAPMTNHMWAAMCHLLGHPEYAEPGHPYASAQGRLDAYDTLLDLVGSWAGTRTVDSIVKTLGERRIACGKVRQVADLFDDEQVRSRHMLRTVDYQGVSVTVPGPVLKHVDSSERAAPSHLGAAHNLGAHTYEILESLAFSDQHIQSLCDRGIVRIGGNNVKR